MRSRRDLRKNASSSSSSASKVVLGAAATDSASVGSPLSAVSASNNGTSKLAAVPHELVVRSLRRRFWQALQQEDGSKALRLYQATRADWECLLLQEQAEAAAAAAAASGRKMNKHHNNSSSHNLIPVLQKQRTKKWGRRRRSSSVDYNNNSRHSSGNISNSALLVAAIKEEEDRNTSVILPQVLKPADFFVQDDFMDPTTEPYPEFNNTFNVTANATTRNEPPANNNNNNNNRGRRSWFRRSASSSSLSVAMEDSSILSQTLLHQPPLEDTRRTTPLHEAARIGNGDLVRCLLEWAGGGEECDINIKNGVMRTPLHSAAGGLTAKEATRVTHQDEIAILAYKPPHENNNNEEDDADSRVTTGPRRLFARSKSRRSSKSLRQMQQNSTTKKSTKKISPERFNALAVDRMGAVMALLTAGASTNSVDQHMRTPLHYAAALNRINMVGTFINSFGTLLTVVDSFSRTPAEWAALHNHNELAAQLEARALLFMDPLDMDLLESLQEHNAESQQQDDDARVLSPPFAWFTTLTMARVQKEREFRAKVTLDRIQKIVERLKGGKSARDILQKVTSTGSSSTSANRGTDNELQPSPNSSSRSLSDASEEEFSPPPPNQDLSRFSALHEGQVEQFLAEHEWDVKLALAAFYEDPLGSFEKAKAVLPVATVNAKTSGAKICLICCDEFDGSSVKNKWRDLSCGHGFCVNCLGDYLTDCAKSRESGLSVPCPHHDCSVALSAAQVSELVPSEEIKRVLTETSNNNFVVKAQDFRFCPHAGCDHVVKFIPPKNKTAEKLLVMSASGAVCCTPESHAKRRENSPFITYEGIYDVNYFDCQSVSQPPKAHRFCFLCGEAVHWPVSCQRLEQWKATVAEHVKEAQEDGDADGTDYKDVSHKLWIKANTRPCPKCKAPIEKNDGCNHVTCSNPSCKHEFCWICRNDWSLHGTSTGGFFRCNRWVEDGEGHQFYDTAPPPEALQTPTDEDLTDPRRMRAVYGTAMHESRVTQKRSREMARFLHHYQRFGAHADSAALEASMADRSAERLKGIVKAAVEFSGDPTFNFGGKGLSFVFDAFTELRECRSVLQHSYAFSFFRYAGGKRSGRTFRRRLAEGLTFEQMQAELEMITEQMSDLVARQHMRATQSQILYMTLTAAQKRRDFSSFMMRVLTKGKDEAESSDEGSDLSDNSTHGRAARLSALFRPLPGETALITGLAARGDQGPNMIDRQRNEGFFGDLPLPNPADPGFQASLRAFRENTGALDLLQLDTSFDSYNMMASDDDDNEDEPRGWSCSTCTFINSRGRFCEMCGTPYSPS